MRDSECVAFLQWCLPRLGMRWAGFRKVRGTVCKRITRRIRALGLADRAAYRGYLADHAEEWQCLETFCRIPISRLWRDRAVFEWLASVGLPERAALAAERNQQVVRLWSAGCASGEEAYSLRLAWTQGAEAATPSVGLEIVATDADDQMIARAKAARYSAGSVRELPPDLRSRAFDRDGEDFVLRDAMKTGVVFLQQDLRRSWPDGPFDLICCRNTAFTYFDAHGQRQILDRLAERLRPDGLLIVGGHEALPGDDTRFSRVANALPVYRRGPSEP